LVSINSIAIITYGTSFDAEKRGLRSHKTPILLVSGSQKELDTIAKNFIRLSAHASSPYERPYKVDFRFTAERGTFYDPLVASG
jgi:hypothetical protein